MEKTGIHSLRRYICIFLVIFVERERWILTFKISSTFSAGHPVMFRVLVSSKDSNSAAVKNVVVHITAKQMPILCLKTLAIFLWDTKTYCIIFNCFETACYLPEIVSDITIIEIHF